MCFLFMDACCKCGFVAWKSMSCCNSMKSSLFIIVFVLVNTHGAWREMNGLHVDFEWWCELVLILEKYMFICDFHIVWWREKLKNPKHIKHGKCCEMVEFSLSSYDVCLMRRLTLKCLSWIVAWMMWGGCLDEDEKYWMLDKCNPHLLVHKKWTNKIYLYKKDIGGSLWSKFWLGRRYN